MGKYFDELEKDYRMKEGLKACMNCGVCTAVCPAAEFYKYNPKNIVNVVARKDDTEIEELLKSDTIWYCGECMSCVTRCPRGNAPGLVVMALRKLSMKTGLYLNSEKGRQQYILVKDLCTNILEHGYCIYPRNFDYAHHPEFGTVGEWTNNNLDEIHRRLGSNLDGDGPGGLRKIPQESLDQLKKIFDVTGATELMDKIFADAADEAEKRGLSQDEYFEEVYHADNGHHLNQ